MELKKNDRLREVLAQEAAKIIVTEGVRDYQQAKHKACERIGNSHYGSLPSNFEIERAVSNFQHTFIPEHDAVITELRQTALVIMHWLQKFSPYLVGPVMEGTAHASTPISIHVFSDVVEEVIEVLQAYAEDLKIEERRMKLGKENTYLPTVIFFYQQCEVAVSIFSLRQQHQRPKSKIKNQGIQRMNISNLEILLN